MDIHVSNHYPQTHVKAFCIYIFFMSVKQHVFLPKIEKITTPAKTEVPQLIMETNIASL